MVRFKPLSKEEASRVLPKGEYQFAVESAIAKKSKEKQLDMFEVNVRVYGPDKEVLVRDYLLCDGVMAYKLRHFCESIGKLADYEAGELYPEAFAGLSGRCKLATEQKDDYPEKNVIKDYVVAEANGKKKPEKAPVPQGNELPDEIPF